VIHRCCIRAVLSNTPRQYLGFITERRYFIGGRRGELHNQGRQDLAEHRQSGDNFRRSLGTIGIHNGTCGHAAPFIRRRDPLAV
jgi:hypothetical protein